MNTNLDLRGSVLEVSYLDPELGRDRHVTIDFGDRDCLAKHGVREIVGHALVASERFPGFCSEREVLAGYVDGDDRIDLVFHDWIKGEAILGICSASRWTHEIAGSGMTELLEIHDVVGDGKEEIFYGGTTCCARYFDLAVARNRQLVPVTTRRGETLTLVSGHDGTRRETGAAFGCEDVDGDGRPELVQIRVGKRQGSQRWWRIVYQIRGARAIRIDRIGGWLPGKSPRIHWPERAAALVSPC